MHQTLHVLIVDEEGGRAVAARHGQRWLLPIVVLPERVRAGPALAEWCLARGWRARFVGQWLGRATPDGAAIDWLAVLVSSENQTITLTDGLDWIDLASLASATSLFEYQQWAVTKTLASGERPSVPGPFGTIEWTRTIDAWLADALSGAGRCECIVPCRATPYELVLELRTADGVLYFKGLASDRAVEARLTTTLASVAPESFAHTRALLTRPDDTTWWLMDACPGVPAANDLTRDRIVSIAQSFARLQQRINEARAGGLQLELPILDLSAMVAWAAEYVADVTPFEDACAQVCRREYPVAWLWADFDAANVIIAGDEARFIDLDDSALGPAPIAISTFARRLRQSGLGRDDLDAVYAAYERAWQPSLRLDKRASEIVSRLVECHLAWRRVVVKTVRGEIFGVIEIARDRLARRLASAVSNGDEEQSII